MATTTSSDPTNAVGSVPATTVVTTSADPLAAPPTAPTSVPASSAAPSAPASAPAPAVEPAAASATAAATPAPDSTATVEQQKDAEEAELTPLTKKFTEPEWEALRKFRALLPAAFADAYDKDPEAKNKTIRMWGVDIDPQHPEKDARVSVILVKFLRARNLNPIAAQEMLVKTLRWRQIFDIDSLMSENFDPAIFGSMAYIYGKDKEGKPVTYNIYGGNQDIKAVFGDVPRFVRWRVQFMEKSIEALDFINVDQMVQVHDYEGVSMSSRDANTKNAASECTSIFQSHYPEFLSKKLFVNVPSLMAWVFWAFKPFLSAATFAKMSVVGSGGSAIGKAMLPLVDANELPKRYGGAARGW